jgi:uncharacterized membrane protein YfcA
MIPPWLKDSVAPLLAIIVVIGGFVMMYLKPEQKTEIAGMITIVLMFYFGSSKGSQDKDQIIANMPPPVEKANCCHKHEGEEAEG